MVHKPHFAEWLELLQRVNPKIYAPQLKVVRPRRIRAQYEQSVSHKPRSFTGSYRRVTAY